MRNLVPKHNVPVVSPTGRASKLAIARAYGPQALVLLLYVVLSWRLFRIVSRFSVNIFFGDAWAFDYYLLSEHHSLWQMFRWQYGPHRAGVGAILMYCVGNWSRWNSRTEAFVAAAIIVSAAGVALLLKKRLYGGITSTDALIPLLILVPSQFPMLVSAPNVSHGALPLLLLILYCLAWTVSSEILKYSLILLLNLFLVYTGFGLFVGFLTPLLLAFDFYKNMRGQPVWKRVYSIVIICLSAASLASFFIGYSFGSAVICYGSANNPTVSFDLVSLPNYARFISLMFANFFGINGTTLWATLVGGLTLVTCITCLAFSLKRFITTSTRSFAANAVPAMLLTYCAIFAVLTAIGRLCLGLQAAQEARYMPYLALGLLGVYFFLLSSPSSKARSVSFLVLAVFALFASVSINSADRGAMIWVAHGKREWKSCYLRNHNAELCDKQTNFRVMLESDEKAKQQKFDLLQQKKLNLYASAD